MSITTSIRLTAEINKRLTRAAARLSRGKNWIISKAVEDYLARINREDLAAEARRQSLAAARDEQRSGKKAASWEVNIPEWK